MALFQIILNCLELILNYISSTAAFPFHAGSTQFQWFSSPELWDPRSQLDCKLYQGQLVFFYDIFFQAIFDIVLITVSLLGIHLLQNVNAIIQGS